MRRFYKTIGILLLSGALLCPTVDLDAQNRGRNNGGGQRTHAPASRPGNGGQRPGNGGQRPGNGGQRPGNGGQRPGNGGQRPGGNHNNNRPGGNHHNNRPGGNNRPDHRPDNRPNNRPNRPGNDRPGGPGGPNYGHNPGHRPGPPPSHGGHHHGPMRPHMPPPRPWHRPAPPPSWRPAPSWRPFRSILGVTLGTAFNLSINALINSGYTINSYGNNQIYLANVPMLNLMWPDAVMYYNSAGYLCGSRFVYSTPGYSMNQYNMAYTSLSNAYGPPVSIQNLANGIEATWWGTDNQFIRLTYSSDYANNGYLRYFTTLSFGN